MRRWGDCKKSPYLPISLSPNFSGVHSILFMMIDEAMYLHLIAQFWIKRVA